MRSSDRLLWVFVAALIVLVVVCLNGCGTIAGLGRDLRAASEGVAAGMSEK